jgi:hypothetical protein
VPDVPERPVTVSEVGKCPLTRRSHNDGAVCPSNLVLAGRAGQKPQATGRVLVRWEEQ